MELEEKMSQVFIDARALKAVEKWCHDQLTNGHCPNYAQKVLEVIQKERDKHE